MKTCCADKHGPDACGQCTEFPCAKYADRAKIERGSFVTHKRIFCNHEFIRAHGFDRFMADQNERVAILREMLTKFDDGRSKGFSAWRRRCFQLSACGSQWPRPTRNH